MSVRAALSRRLGRRARSGARAWRPVVQDDAALAAVLHQVAKRHHQPARGAAPVRGDAIVAKAAAGSTLTGGARPLDADSRFHIGSTTKGVTSLESRLRTFTGPAGTTRYLYDGDGGES